MKKLMQFLFLSCLEATEMIEKKLHYELSIIEKLQLNLHKAMCKACALYEKQSIFLDHGISQAMKNDEVNDMSDFKNLILKKLFQS